MPKDERVQQVLDELASKNAGVEDATVNIVDAAVSAQEGAIADREVQDTKEVLDDNNNDTDTAITDTKAEIDAAKYEEAVKAQESFGAILEKHGFDSLEELQEAVDSGESLRQLIGNRDANQMVEDVELFDKYKAHWEEQEKQKLKEEEEPDDTISRLEKELNDTKKAEFDRKNKSKAVKEAEAAIRFFNNTATSEIDKSDLPKEYAPYLSTYLGVDSPATNVDVSKKTEIRKHAQQGIKDFKAFEQVVIKNYLNGKSEVTKVPPADTTKAPVDKEPENKNGLEGLRATFAERMNIRT